MTKCRERERLDLDIINKLSRASHHVPTTSSTTSTSLSLSTFPISSSSLSL
ncbi:hypothetical protein CsSME_00027457 [Camellia sinensis var. sinensis]